MHLYQVQTLIKKVVHSMVLYFIAYELIFLSDVNFVELLSKRPYIMLYEPRFGDATKEVGVCICQVGSKCLYQRHFVIDHMINSIQWLIIPDQL